MIKQQLQNALYLSLLLLGPLTHAQLADPFQPLELDAVQLNGQLNENIQNCMQNWSIAKVPYSEFASFFSKGRPKFASGEMWGKAVRAGSMFYSYTRNEDLKVLLDKAVQDLLATEKENGSISCSPIEKQPDPKGGDIWERKYVLLGLERYYSLVNDDPAILESMIRQMDCLVSQIGEAPKMSIVEAGWSTNSIEACTILEPVMRLYNLTENPDYLEFATYLVNQGGAKGVNLIDQALANVPPRKMAGEVYPKAYDMLSYFEGLAEYYRVTGDERIKTAIVNLYRNVLEKEMTIVGNGGCDLYHSTGECWGDTAHEQTNPDIHRMMETCVGVTWLKYCSQVLRLTGDPSVVDAMETYIYNGLIGSQRADGDTFSYANLLNGKKDNPLGWGVYFYNKGRITCCELNGPMGLAYIPYVAVMNSSEGPVVNLYNAGNFSFQTPEGQSAELTLVSDFPMSGNVRMLLTLEKTEAFDLRLRIPAWSLNTELNVNEKSTEAPAGSYRSLKQTWKSGDQIELILDMNCRLIDSPKDDHVAVLYGPTVLARDENRDDQYRDPVNVTAENQRAEAIQETPPVNAIRMQFKIPTSEGFIRMIDYASCNNWNGKRTTTWMKKKGMTMNKKNNSIYLTPTAWKESKMRVKIYDQSLLFNHPAFDFVEQDETLPNVLIIGDSISIGYTPFVREQLKGIANVYRIPTNGGWVGRGLENIDFWIDSVDWDVIHFNWGQHDIKRLNPTKQNQQDDHLTAPDDYFQGLETLISTLKQTDAKLIWANTTPVPEGCFNRVPGDEIRYNELAAKVMKNAGIQINDLHAHIREHLTEYQKPDDIHFREAGSEFLSRKVTKTLKESL